MILLTIVTEADPLMSKQTRVLLADGTRLLDKLQHTAFDRSSIIVRISAIGEDIAQAAREWLPDVLLLEEGESCPEALEICRAMRRQPETAMVPIILVGLAIDRSRAARAGVSVFIPRPVTRRDLREALRRVVEVADRVAIRREVRIPVELLVESREKETGGSSGEVIDGLCLDLSLSGAFVELTRRQDPGTRGQLLLSAGARDLRLDTEIVRYGPGAFSVFGAGLRFVNLDATTGGILSRFVRRVGERRQVPRSGAEGQQ